MTSVLDRPPAAERQLTPDLWEKLARAETHDLRLQILHEFAGEPTPSSPNRLSEILDAPLNTVAYHVRELVGAGIIVLDHTEQRRGATEHFYVLPNHGQRAAEAAPEGAVR